MVRPEARRPNVPMEDNQGSATISNVDPEDESDDAEPNVVDEL